MLKVPGQRGRKGVSVSQRTDSSPSVSYTGEVIDVLLTSPNSKNLFSSLIMHGLKFPDCHGLVGVGRSLF